MRPRDPQVFGDRAASRVSASRWMVNQAASVEPMVIAGWERG